MLTSQSERANFWPWSGETANVMETGRIILTGMGAELLEDPRGEQGCLGV